MKIIKLGLITFILSSSMAIADIKQELAQLQKRWAEVNYTIEGKAKKEAFETLIAQASQVTQTYPDAAESWIWQGIIKSSYAGAKGGFGAMSLAKASKADLEKAMGINDKALSGSAYTSLGTLYFKVPSWPIGFGDDDKAKELLEKALVINPDGIDSNYFYADFLVDQREYSQAEKYLLKAQHAPARSNRPVADKGRHDEITVALEKVRLKLQKKNNASITDRR